MLLVPGVAAEKRKREKEALGPGEKPAKKGKGKAAAKPKAKAAARATEVPKEWPEDDDDAWTDGDDILADGFE